jgi:Uma2 family endonuclease
MQGSTESADRGVLVQHFVPGFSENWLVGDVPVPEAAWHDRALELLKAVFEHWIARTARDAAVFRNLAIRVRRELPRVGIDPDLILVEPAPPEATELSSLRLWEPGHAVPSLVVEVVSPGHPYKDYAEVPDQCAALGVRELVVFDPLLAGPRALGGPKRLQIWRRTDEGSFVRVACGDGPFPSTVVAGYFMTTDDGRRLRIAEDGVAARLWPTPEEAERRRADEECIQAVGRFELERAEKERALARVAELERELARRSTKE